MSIERFIEEWIKDFGEIKQTEAELEIVKMQADFYSSLLRSE